ncbi:MAG: TaqI-like C-terminal specificity domain-containing protein [Microcoleaceae cyanobacterium MO_207.B10]|nr:TaqI-like C-terminal specificity domain-containing protein [Microcoleaceae cyanobacterium MO_207.B10]
MVTNKQQINKPLFSQHYLDRRLQECPEWHENVGPMFEALKNLYLSKRDLLPTLNEAQTEDIFIKPALQILGFTYIPQIKTSGKGRTQRPDYALFYTETERDTAYHLQNDEPAFYARVTAIAEAKYWERPLHKVSANDKRDIYKNENPSFQITSYLMGTGVDWGILTNGREWRLYYRQVASRATEFYQVDLVELLEEGNIERFKYFWLFFRQEAFVKDSQGRNFLERVREGSTTYSARVGDELKDLVFHHLFPDLAGGFVVDATRQGEQVAPTQVYQATLSFLYKLLFLLYAEARNLLPINSDYRDYSLTRLTQEVAQSMDTQKNLSQTSTAMYDHLLNLFQIIDRGDVGLGVPRYNGGLFHFESAEEDSANDFLKRYKLTDALLAPVLDRLARFEGLPIDYGFLGVRQLGSIYEGLLEYRVVIEDAATGKVHLENDQGERKATGSYYTPEYIVKYIVSHAVKPILVGREERFKQLMGEIGEVRDRLQDKRLGKQSIKGLQKDLQRLQRKAQSTLLDIKVCDPAMGSGHFLVEAVDYLTDELIGILNQYPEDNPVLPMLEETRQGILANLAEQGITINPDKLEPVQLLQRVVMKRCIYGVDLNPMAVELAKVSLWLHSFTIGAPLSFLDHHLRCGNSLIGTTAREAEAEMAQEESGQLNLLAGPFVGLLKAAEIMRGVSVLSDATFAEVEQSERLFRSFDEAAKPYKRLLDVYVSQFFGVKQAKNFLERLGTAAITINPGKMKKVDRVVYEEAQKLGEERRFFHWDLEFPEVFIDLESASWKENGGFDIVVGNPPYVTTGELRNSDILSWQYYKQLFLSASKGKFDLYIPFIEHAYNLAEKYQGRATFILPNKWLKSDAGTKIREFLSSEKAVESILDFGAFQVFQSLQDKGPTTYTCVCILSKEPKSFINYHRVELEPQSQIEIPNWKSIDYPNFQSSPWQFSTKLFSDSLSEDKFFNLDRVATVFVGTTTNADPVFILQKEDKNSASKLKAYSEQQQDFIEIEKEVSLPFLRGKDLDRFGVTNTNLVVLFPYYGDRHSLLIEPNKFENKYPLAWKYLSQHKNKLESREGSKWKDKSDWYCHAYPRNHSLLGIPKIITPDICTSGKFTLDETGKYHILNTVYGITKVEFGLSIKYLLCILNSAVFETYIRANSVDLRGGYYRVSKNFIVSFPVRKIDFITPSNRLQKSLENLINLYQKYQTNNNPELILNQVNYHLRQKLEEADIIHDLLAYLAEQMLELNQQKQTEIKSFLQWLERFIGSPIDKLTNKTKINNYLGDYYKDEPHLSFDDLIAVLKKNKKKIKIDPVARKDQQTLEKEYQSSLEKLLPLKTELKQCDKLIDKIVYQLYGLTDEEIAIVERR